METRIVRVSQSEQSTITVIFEFPPKSINDEIIAREVKEIMISALREQLNKTS